MLNLAYARDDVTDITPWNCRLPARVDGDVRDVGPEAAEFGFARAMYFGAEGELDAIFSSAGQFLDDLDIIFEEGERQGYEGEGLAGIRV